MQFEVSHVKLYSCFRSHSVLNRTFKTCSNIRVGNPREKPKNVPFMSICVWSITFSTSVRILKVFQCGPAFIKLNIPTANGTTQSSRCSVSGADILMSGVTSDRESFPALAHRKCIHLLSFLCITSVRSRLSRQSANSSVIQFPLENEVGFSEPRHFSFTLQRIWACWVQQGSLQRRKQEPLV